MDVRKILDALLAKTVANGATPGEAIAAAEKAWELKQKYKITEHSPLPEGIICRSKALPKWRFLFACRLGRGVDKFCEVKGSYTIVDSEEAVPADAKVWFVGYCSDVEFAFDLLDRLFVQMEASGAIFFSRAPSPDDRAEDLVLFCHQRRSRLNDRRLRPEAPRSRRFYQA